MTNRHLLNDISFNESSLWNLSLSLRVVQAYTTALLQVHHKNYSVNYKHTVFSICEEIRKFPCGRGGGVHTPLHRGKITCSFVLYQLTLYPTTTLKQGCRQSPQKALHYTVWLMEHG